MKSIQDLKLEYKQETGLEPIVTAYGFRPYLTWLEERLLEEFNKEIESESQEPSKHPTSWRDFTMTDDVEPKETAAEIHNPDWGRVFRKNKKQQEHLLSINGASIQDLGPELITTHDLADLDQQKDDYYNRDKLFERRG